MSARLGVDVAPVAFAPPPRPLRIVAHGAPAPEGARPADQAPPRLRALLAASGTPCDGMLLLWPGRSGGAAPRLLLALCEAHALAHGGHALAGLGQTLLVLAPAAALPRLADEARLLDPAIDSRLFRLPGESAALVAAAAPWFSAGAGARPQASAAPARRPDARAAPRPDVIAAPRPDALAAPRPDTLAAPRPDTLAAPRREPIATLARGLPPHLQGFRLVGGGPIADDPPIPIPGDLGLWHEPRPWAAPPPGFAGTALVGPTMLAEPAILAAWRDRLAADGGRLAVGPFGAAEIGWLNLAAIPAHLLLLRWSAALPAALVGPLPADRIVLTSADLPAALAWGLGVGIGAYAGTVVEALLAAQRLAVCPYAAACDAGACAGRAAATQAAGRAGCGNPVLLARWAP